MNWLRPAFRINVPSVSEDALSARRGVASKPLADFAFTHVVIRKRPSASNPRQRVSSWPQ
jgi:hypothetical protein